MYKIKTFNNIDPEGLKRLPPDFVVSQEDDYDGIILRSYKMSEAELTQKLCAVARAGAGVNNIPVELYSQSGVVVFNAPGANANAVKELVILGMLLSTRKVVDGIEWLKGMEGADDEVEKEIEAQKSVYTGPEILGKSVGVIGLGAIGSMVANTMIALGMQVYGYDPYVSVEAAWNIDSSVKRVNSIEWMFANCDFITLHIPLMEQTKEFVNSALLAKTKDGLRLINFARGGLCSDDAILEAVANGKLSCYVTDFPTAKMVNHEGVIAIPHLGASTPESETNCAIMVADQITNYLINGNVKNSVNFPDCDMGELSGKMRVTINHKNVPNMVGQITTALANQKINISDMINKSKGEYAYTILDVDSSVNGNIISDLSAIEGVLKVRILGNN